MKGCWKFGKLKVPAILLLMLGICTVGVAQEVGGHVEEDKPLTIVQMKMRKKISVEFRDTPIDDVIRAIARQVDLDIVKGPDVTGNVTATLTDVPLEEALNHILTSYGSGFVASENMIRIVPATQLTEESEKMTSKVYRIVYADINEVQKALEKVVSKRGSLSFNAGTSNIMVTDTESKVAAIDSFVEEMDRRTPQILVEVRIYDVKDSDSLDLGIEWFAGRNTGYGTGRADGFGSPGAEGGPVMGQSRSDPFGVGIFESTIDKVESTGTLNFGIITEHTDLSVLISAIQEQDSAKLLANPRLLVLDNEEATFKAIEEIPYQQLQQGGFEAFGTTEFKEIGVELTVTPHLAKDGMIRLHVIPVFSVQVGDVQITTVGTGGVPISSPQPIVDTRETDTKALVRDGQTMVIAGMRKQTIQKLVSEIPLLCDIPLIGPLFRFNGEEAVNSELVVFITPRLIEHDGVLTNAEQEKFNKTELPPVEEPYPMIDFKTKKITPKPVGEDHID
ncbi:MAG: secretin N-terminal domain-containing protein [Planctomycetota bacterium]|jgi:type IV pilus assembly protein PilQ